MSDSKYLCPPLVNGEAIAAECPKTFQIPPQELRHTLLKGDSAKVASQFENAELKVGGERYWVTVLMQRNGIYYGVIDSKLLFTADHGLAHGDRIKFCPANVLDIVPRD